MISLRPYQTTARHRVNALLNASRFPVFVSPTGTGKTLTATAIIADRIRLKRRVYVLVPQVEIFEQFVSSLARAGLNPGTIADGKVVIHLMNADTKELPFGLYEWDIRFPDLYGESEPYTPMDPAKFEIARVIGDV